MFQIAVSLESGFGFLLCSFVEAVVILFCSVEVHG